MGCQCKTVWTAGSWAFHAWLLSSLKEQRKRGGRVSQLVCEIDILCFFYLPARLGPEYKVLICQRDPDMRRVLAVVRAGLVTISSDYTVLTWWLDSDAAAPFLFGDSAPNSVQWLWHAEMFFFLLTLSWTFSRNKLEWLTWLLEGVKKDRCLPSWNGDFVCSYRP